MIMSMVVINHRKRLTDVKLTRIKIGNDRSKKSEKTHILKKVSLKRVNIACVPKKKATP